MTPLSPPVPAPNNRLYIRGQHRRTGSPNKYLSRLNHTAHKSEFLFLSTNSLLRDDSRRLKNSFCLLCLKQHSSKTVHQDPPRAKQTLLLSSVSATRTVILVRLFRSQHLILQIRGLKHHSAPSTTVVPACRQDDSPDTPGGCTACLGEKARHYSPDCSGELRLER